MQLDYSFIVPVYNRPNEILELLESMVLFDFDKDYEIVIVEDGSTETAEEVIKSFQDRLNISYYFKPNSGPGDSRNYGMRKAKGNYFIILDSDVIMPPNYLTEIDQSLQEDFVHCFGGPDDAHESFTKLQKAISYSMTSYLTTGGIRGKAGSVDKFQPRSFNMGISKEAFQQSEGFGNIHPGEDPDLTIRLWNLGYRTKLIATAKVFHKRRISWKKFFIQVNKFGKVRPILNKWHPSTAKITYWFPTAFLLFTLMSVVATFFGYWYGLAFLGFYFFLILIGATAHYQDLGIGLRSVVAVAIQFYGYGRGFVTTYFPIHWGNKNPEEHFPKLFFKKQ